MEPTVRNFTITGNAAQSFMKKGTRKRQSKKQGLTAQNGGSNEEVEHDVSIKRGGGSVDIPSPSPSPFPFPLPVPLPVPSVLSYPQPSNPLPLPLPLPLTSEHVTNNVKVVLGGGRKKTTKVILASQAVKRTHHRPRTRKIAKKIRMSLGSFGKRVSTAKAIRNQAKKESIESIKKTLVDAKLVKTESKAPEDVLRQMYSDYMMLKKQAL